MYTVCFCQLSPLRGQYYTGSWSVPVLFSVFQSFLDWLAVWVQRSSHSHFPGCYLHTQLSTETIHTHVHSPHLAARYPSHAARPPTEVPHCVPLWLISYSTIVRIALFTMFFILITKITTCMLFIFFAFNSAPAEQAAPAAPAEDWGGCGFYNRMPFAALSIIIISHNHSFSVAAGHVCDLVLNVFFNYFFPYAMWQVVYADISQGVPRQQRANREPDPSTVYSSVRFSWACSENLSTQG